MRSTEDEEKQKLCTNKDIVCYCFCLLLCCFVSIYFYIHLDLIKKTVTTQDHTMTLLLMPKATTTTTLPSPSSATSPSLPSSSKSSSSVASSISSAIITSLETADKNQDHPKRQNDHGHDHDDTYFNIQMNTTCSDTRNSAMHMEYTYPQGIPTFIIAGQHKCGTTALFRILQTHPNLLPSNVFESHFFDQLSMRPSRHKYFNKNFIHRSRLRQQKKRRAKKNNNKENGGGGNNINNNADIDIDLDPTTIQQSAICYERYNYAKENFNVPTVAVTAPVGSDKNNNKQDSIQRRSVYNVSNQQKQRRRRKRKQISLQPQHVGSFEKTPAYISYQYVIPNFIKTILPWTKIIVSLRNPVDRLTSDIVKKVTESRNKMKGATANGNATTMEVDNVDEYNDYDKFFEYAVGKEFRDRMKNITTIMLQSSTTSSDPNMQKNTQLFESRNLIRDGIVRGIYIEQIEPWLEYFTLNKDILIFPYETFLKHPQRLLDDIHEFVNVPSYNYTPKVLYYDHSPNLRPHEQGLYNISLRQSKILASGITKSEGGEGGEEGGSGGAASSSSSSSSSFSPPIIPDYFRKELHQFYKPYNDRLFDLLKDDPRFHPSIWDE